MTNGGIDASEPDEETLGDPDGVRIGLGEDECAMGSSGIGVPSDPPLDFTRFCALELHPMRVLEIPSAIPALAAAPSARRRERAFGEGACSASD